MTTQPKPDAARGAEPLFDVLVPFSRLPWTLDGDTIRDAANAKVFESFTCDSSYDEQDAAFIVRAVNNHWALIVTVENFLAEFEGMDDTAISRKYGTSRVVMVRVAREVLENATKGGAQP